jgi:hypothetical protein
MRYAGLARVLRRGEDMAMDGAAGDVNASGSQGVQTGPGSTQNNTWISRQPLSAATLAALSPHAAIARIRQLPHDDAVDLFASTPAEDLTAKLKALLLTDEATAVAILADLDPLKAAVLINPYKDNLPWLTALPRAAEAIAQCAVDLKWSHEGRLERAAPSPKMTEGYFRQYEQGRIYASADKPIAYPVRGPIAELHLASGGTGGEFGFPDDWDFGEVSGETEGVWQAFEDDFIASSSHGTYRVPDKIAPCWTASGRCGCARSRTPLRALRSGAAGGRPSAERSSVRVCRSGST